MLEAINRQYLDGAVDLFKEFRVHNKLNNRDNIIFKIINLL